MSAGFLLDLHRCVGCGACVLACRIENGRIDAGAWRRVPTQSAAAQRAAASVMLPPP
jgi:Fe-S-cluster-containing dehydrogenase component